MLPLSVEEALGEKGLKRLPSADDTMTGGCSEGRELKPWNFVDLA